MRFNRILTLVKTNLIFATQPAQLQNYRKKQAKNPSKPVNVAMRTLMQQLLFAMMFGALFGIPGAISGRSYPPLKFASMVFLFKHCQLFTMSFMKVKTLNRIYLMPLRN